MTGTTLVVRDHANALIQDISGDLLAVLPKNMPLDRFRGTFVTAVSHNPELIEADPQTLKTALLKCAIDRLMPDGREAAITVFNTKVKREGRDVYIKAAQYMPMVQGIRRRAKELGGVKTIVCECVYENDKFLNIRGDDPRIEHTPTPFGQEPGKIIGAYAIFKENDKGEILHREAMPLADIEKVRQFSRAKDGQAWTRSFPEMARKTVLRRGSKSVPNMPEELRTIIERDDDYVDLTATEVRSDPNYNPLVANAKLAALITHNAAGAAKEVEHEDHVAKSQTVESVGQDHPGDQRMEEIGANAGLGNQQGSAQGVTSAAGEQAATNSNAGQGDGSPSLAAEAQGSAKAAPGLPSSGAAASAETIALMNQYSEALFRASQPKNVPTVAAAFWEDKTKPADRSVQETFGKIQAAHTKRCAAEISITDCKKVVDEIIRARVLAS